MTCVFILSYLGRKVAEAKKNVKKWSDFHTKYQILLAILKYIYQYEFLLVMK